jgi:hypothetical protein
MRCKAALRKCPPWTSVAGHRVLLATCAAFLSSAVPPAGAQGVPAPPRPSGYIQARESYQDGTGLSASLNRVRLGADGSLPSGFSYRVLVEYESATATTAAVGLRDAFVRWSATPWAVQAGQFKVPFSREYLTSITAIETAERSAVVDALAPKRDLGVMAEVALPSSGGLWLGAFNGEGQNLGANRDSTLMLVGRASVRPLAIFQFAANAAGYGSDSTRYGLEGNAEWRGFLARGEWIGQRRRGRSTDDRGWFALGAYRLRPWLQLVARQEDLRQSAIGASRRNRATTVGANVDLPGGRVRLLADYVSRTTGSPGTRRGLLITQAQVRF